MKFFSVFRCSYWRYKF